MIYKIAIMIVFLFLTSCSGGGSGGGNTSSNLPPIISPEDLSYSFYLDENTSIQATVPDDIYLLEVLENPLRGTLTLTSNIASYIPQDDFVGVDRVKIRGTKNGDSVEVTINFNVLKVNNKPVVEDSIVYVEKGNGKLFDLIASDEDGDTLSYELVGYPEYGSLVLKPNNSGNWGYDAPNVELETFFTYRVSDGNLYSDVATVTIRVTRENFEPNVLDYENTISLNEDNSYNFGIIVNDADNDNVSVNTKIGPSNGELVIIKDSESEYQITYVPEDNYFGEDSFVIEFNDGIGGIIEKETLVTVNAINDKPETVVSSLSYIIEKNSFGELIDLQISDIDNDLSDLDIEFIQESTLVDFYISNTKKLTMIPKYNVVGTETLFLYVTDGEDNSTLITLSVEVRDSNIPSVVPINQSLSMNQGDNLTITLSGENAESRNVIYIIESQPGNGDIVVNLNSITYTPDSSFYGNDSISFKIMDNDNNYESVLGFISIKVNRTDFSNTWSIDLTGNLFENEYIKEESTYILDNKFFISNNKGSIYSLFTEDMSCTSFESQMMWVPLNSSDSQDSFDKTEHWYCYDSFNLLNEEEVLISNEDILSEINKNNIFAESFPYNISDRLLTIKNISECSFVNIYRDLDFIIGEESLQQKECFFGIYNHLKSSISSLDSYYRINENSLVEGVYPLVVSYLKYSEDKDLEDNYLDKEGLFAKIIEENFYYINDKLGFLGEFPLCRAIVENIDEEVNIYDYIITEQEEDCIMEIFSYLDNYPNFYKKSGLSIPSNKLTYNTEIFNIVDNFVLYLDESDPLDLLSCSSMNRKIYNYYLRHLNIQNGQSFQDNIQSNIQGCSEDDLHNSEQYSDFFYVHSDNVGYKEADPETGYPGGYPDLRAETQVTCQLNMLNDLQSKIYYSDLKTSKGADNNFDDIYNKVNISLLLDTIRRFDEGICQPIDNTILLNQYIYSSGDFSIHKKEKSDMTDIYMGFDKGSASYSLDYSSFVGNNIKKISLISGLSSSLGNSLLALGQSINDNSQGDFVKLEGQQFNTKDIYSKINLNEDELILTGLYTIETEGMTPYYNDTVGKLIIYDSKLLIFTHKKESGYYWYEVTPSN